MRKLAAKTSLDAEDSARAQAIMTGVNDNTIIGNGKAAATWLNGQKSSPNPPPGGVNPVISYGKNDGTKTTFNVGINGKTTP